MKKSVLSLIALAIASVSVFTSCDKSNDGYDNQTPVQNLEATSGNAQQYNCFAYFINDQMASYGTWTVTVTDGKKTAEYDIAGQGKHGSFSLGNDPGLQNVSGYLFTLAQPASGNDVKASVKFTPNEMAESLKSDIKLDSKFGFTKFTSTESNPNAESKLYGVKILGSDGDHLVEAYNSFCSFMTGR